MSLYGANVEYGIHCLLHLAGQSPTSWPSSRDVAEFQGVSAPLVAKIFTKLQKAGIVKSSEGIAGGFQLARMADDITILDVVDAVEGGKPLFQCKEIRRNCVLYGDSPPDWAVRGVCAVHAVMLTAESKMREHLSKVTLRSLADCADKKVPESFPAAASSWFENRIEARSSAAGTAGKSRSTSVSGG